MGEVSLFKTEIVAVCYAKPDGEIVESVLTITKLPLGRYAQFLQKLAEIPATISNSVKLLFGDALGLGPGAPAGEVDPMLDVALHLPAILAQHWNDLVGLLSVASGVSEEVLSSIGLNEALQIVRAIISVNDFFDTGGHLREMAAMIKGKKEAKKGPKKATKGG